MIVWLGLILLASLLAFAAIPLVIAWMAARLTARILDRY